MNETLTPIERFVSNIEIHWSGCWIWQGKPTAKGYGRLRIGNRQKQHAHRFAYEHFIGLMPLGYETDHLCRNRLCVNPDHLEAVTREENLRRGLPGMDVINRAKTRCKRGHPFDSTNTAMRLNGKGERKKRHCRICDRYRYRSWYHEIPLQPLAQPTGQP